MAPTSRFHHPRLIALVAIFLFPLALGDMAGCGHRAAADSARRAASAGLVVVVDGRVVHRAPVAFTVRDGAEPESVVSLVDVGELIVGAERCRFVRSDRGLASLQILERRGACAVERGERLCFDDVAFDGDGKAGLVTVSGCADRNELFLDRVAEEREVGIGPRTLIERCVPVPAREPRYIRVDEVSVDDNDDPRRGLRFRWNGDGFDVCFLSRKTGRYRVVLTVEAEPRGHGAVVVVEGDVND